MLRLALLLLALAGTAALLVPSSRKISSASALRMGYVPEGFTPEQWKQMQAKEKSKSQGKNLGQTGITKFQSRSLKAWQEAGANHLFPTDPTGKKKEELPYMMRRGGAWDGKDVKGKGVGQGKAYARSKTDEEYEAMRKKGALDSVSIFGGQSLPWSNAATRAMAAPQKSELEKKMARKVAGKGRGKVDKASLKLPEDEDKPKKFFGLF